jgi:hypothetical protein
MAKYWLVIHEKVCLNIQEKSVALVNEYKLTSILSQNLSGFLSKISRARNSNFMSIPNLFGL